MKKILIIFLVMIMNINTNAQDISDKKSGKYIRTEAKNLYVGTWIIDETGKEIEFLITTKKNRNKFKDHDYYYDALYIEIKKCIYKGEDVAKKIKESIMLPSGDSLRYGSMFFKDPITGDEIIIKIYYINKNNLKLNVNTKYAPGTSTIFPLGNTILKRKGKEK